MEPLDALQDVCRQIDLPLDGLNQLTLTGRDPVLPSSFRVGTAAQVAV